MPPASPPSLHPSRLYKACGIWFPLDTKCETLLEVMQKGIVSISELWLNEGILRRLCARVVNF